MKEKIIALITEILQVPEGTVTETTLMEDLEVWDSVAQVMIIGELSPGWASRSRWRRPWR